MIRRPPRSTLFPYPPLSRPPRIFSHLPHVRLHRLPRSRRIAVLHRIQNLLVVILPTDRKSTRLNSSHSQISYAVFCLKKKIISPLLVRILLVLFATVLVITA